jgi:hypothetical protein
VLEEEVGIVQRVEVEVPPGRRNAEELFWGSDWQRTQQERFDQREDRGRRPNAQRQRQKNGRRECGRATQKPEVVPQILGQCVQVAAKAHAPA